MTEEQNKDALEMLMFIKENRDGTIKACGCVDGRTQREKYNNVYATSPPFSTEAVLISAVIDAYAEQDVAVVDIPGSYISADMGDEMFKIFHGTMEELMVAADPALYRKYI